MKKTIALLAAAGLTLAGCAKQPDPAATVNSGAANGDFNGGDVLLNDGALGDNLAVPPDETADGNAADNLAAPANAL